MTEYIYEYATKRTVTLFDSANNDYLGTGFLISSEGHIITCSHVVFNKYSESVSAILNSSHKIEIAHIEFNFEIDIAILFPEQLENNLPFFQLNTQLSEQLNREILVFGYPDKEYYESYYRLTKIASGVFIETDKLKLPTVGLTDRDIFIEGMSGGPVVDYITYEAIGVIFGYDKNLAKNIYDLDKNLIACEEKRLDDLFIPLGLVAKRMPFLYDFALVDANLMHYRLVQKVSDVLKLLGFDIRHIDLDENGKDSVFSEISFGKIFSFNMLIICAAKSDEQLSKSKINHISKNIEMYQKKLNVAKIEKVAIVVEDNINMEIYNEADLVNIDLINSEDLFERLIDFTDYLKQIEAQWINDRKNISKKYLPLSAWEIVGKEFLRVDSTENYLNYWIKYSEKPGLLILGRYGSGKTTICRHLAYNLATIYMDDNNTKNLIPILIYLRRAKRSSIKQIISQLIDDEFKHITTPRALSKLNELGRLILILDGFDEMSQITDRSQTFQNIIDLSESIKGNSKFILTCRLEYFIESGDIEDLKNERDITRLPDFNLIVLDDFDSVQIESYLKNSLNKEKKSQILKMIKGTANLIELAKRPVLLDMIIETYPYISKERINISTLYETYTSKWLERDIKLGRTILPKEARLELMQKIATEMLEKGKYVIDYESILKLLAETFKEDFHKAAFHIHDLLTNSFLIRNDRDRYYEFAHKSFYDFFIAKKATRDIEFAVEKEICSDNSFASRRLTFEIFQFMMEMKIDSQKLWNLIEKTKNKTLEDVGFIGGNAISLLKAAGADFSNRDYSNSTLGGALFNDTDLSNSKFINANLYDNSFVNAILDNVDMTDADVTRSDFKSGKIIYSLDYSDTNNLIVTDNSAENKVSIWVLDEKDFSLNEKMSITGHSDHVFCVTISPSGKMIASGGQDQSIRIWNIEQNNLAGVLRGHLGDIRNIRYFNNTEIVSCGFDGQIIKWDIDRKVMIDSAKTDEEYWGMSLSRGEKLIALGNLRGALEIWSYETLEKLYVFKPDCDPRRRAVQFMADNEFILITGCSDGSVIFWDYKDNIHIRKNTQNSPIISLAYNQTKKLIASGADDGTIAIWDGVSKKPKITFEAHSDYVNAMMFHPTESILFTASPDGTIAIWDINNFTLLNRYDEQFTNFKFSCNGLIINNIKGIPKSRIKHLKNLGAIERS